MNKILSSLLGSWTNTVPDVTFKQTYFNCLPRYNLYKIVFRKGIKKYNLSEHKTNKFSTDTNGYIYLQENPYSIYVNPKYQYTSVVIHELSHLMDWLNGTLNTRDYSFFGNTKSRALSEIVAEMTAAYYNRLLNKDDECKSNQLYINHHLSTIHNEEPLRNLVDSIMPRLENTITKVKELL